VTRREYWKPHLGQKLKEAVATAAHCGHLTSRRAPHCAQTSAPWSFWRPHAWHRPVTRGVWPPACAQSVQTWSSRPICRPQYGQYLSSAAPHAAQNWLCWRLLLPQAGHTGPACPSAAPVLLSDSGLGLRPCGEDMGVPWSGACWWSRGRPRLASRRTLARAAFSIPLYDVPRRWARVTQRGLAPWGVTQ